MNTLRKKRIEFTSLAYSFESILDIRTKEHISCIAFTGNLFVLLFFCLKKNN